MLHFYRYQFKGEIRTNFEITILVNAAATTGGNSSRLPVVTERKFSMCAAVTDIDCDSKQQKDLSL